MSGGKKERKKKKRRSVSDIASIGGQAENLFFLMVEKHLAAFLPEKILFSVVGRSRDSILFHRSTTLLATKHPDTATGRMNLIFLCRHLCAGNIPHRISELLPASLKHKRYSFVAVNPHFCGESAHFSPAGHGQSLPLRNMSLTA